MKNLVSVVKRKRDGPTKLTVQQLNSYWLIPCLDVEMHVFIFMFVKNVGYYRVGMTTQMESGSQQ